MSVLDFAMLSVVGLLVVVGAYHVGTWSLCVAAGIYSRLRIRTSRTRAAREMGYIQRGINGEAEA